MTVNKNPKQFIGSKAEWFLLYALVSIVSVVVFFGTDNNDLAIAFLVIFLVAAVSAWRAWKRGA